MLPGTALKEAAQVVVACAAGGARCDPSRLGDAEYLWAQAAVSAPLVSDWHRTVGDAHNLIVAACAAVTLAGLVSFVTPVRMMPIALFLLLALLLNTAAATVLPNLLLMNMLGFLLVLGDGSSGGASGRAAARVAAAAPASKQAAPKASSGAKGRQGGRRAKH
ncbi:hypothetical protein FOA52_014390 [Chlamydomonas sp. UWO 241]|nr:hypothetical protein FOA52_014390 [Chlamydomonas sp. UWO 241]